MKIWSIKALSASFVLALLAWMSLAVGSPVISQAGCHSFTMDTRISTLAQKYISALGCPLASQASTPDGRGTYVPYELGWIVEPNNNQLGSNFLMVAHFYTYGSPKIIVDFGPSDPFHYDKWLVRWDKYGGANVGQVDVAGGNGGSYSIENLDRTQTYSVYVEGCDKGGIGPSTCRQGWSPAAVLQIAHENGAKPPLAPSPTHTPWITAKLLGNGATTILDISGKYFPYKYAIMVYVRS